MVSTQADATAAQNSLPPNPTGQLGQRFLAVIEQRAIAVHVIGLTIERLLGIAVTPPGAGQPGKSVLTLSTTLTQVAVALVGKNTFGYAGVLQVPQMISAGQVQTAYRRAAQQRIYPLTLNSVCPFSNITWTYLTAVATS